MKTTVMMENRRSQQISQSSAIISSWSICRSLKNRHTLSVIQI